MTGVQTCALPISVDVDVDGGDSSDPQQEELTSIESGKLGIVERERGWGDTSATWKTPITEFIDQLFTAGALFFARFSPLVARTVDDGAYLRAIFGGYSITLIPVAIIFGIKSLFDAGGQAMAPLLARHFTVVATDLRGYGDSSVPPDGENHEGYSKRALARDQVEVMLALGHEHFAVIGHEIGRAHV